MKTILFAALTLLTACSHAGANSVIIIDIKTTPSAVGYSLNNQIRTPAQISEWMRGTIEKFGDRGEILIRPDSQTTFATVFMLLESLKASGVKHFEIIAECANTAKGFSRYLAFDAQDLKVR